MSRIPLVKDASDNAELQGLYTEICEAGFGVEAPINWFTSQGSRPDILKATWALTKGILIEGQLPHTVKQMIAMAVSMQNNCRYCTVTHTGALESLGVSKTEITSCASDPDMGALLPAQRAIVRFALKAAKDPNSITDADTAVLRENGLADAEIAEVCMMAAFTNFINTWADATGIAVDS